MNKTETTASHTLTAEVKEFVQRCREKLINRYKTENEYTKSWFLEDKLGCFPLKDYFSWLKVSNPELLGVTQFKSVKVNEITLHNSTVLLTGEEGYGKTTLCKKLVHDWACGKQYLQHFDLVALLSLAEVNGKKLKDEVLQTLCDSGEEDRAKLAGVNLELLVILDGYDEFRRKDDIVQFVTEDSGNISRKMTIILSSQKDVKLNEKIDMKIRLEEFSLNDQKEYVRAVFKDKCEKVQSFLTLLNNEFYSTLAKCPLTLHLLCRMHLDHSIESMRKTDLFKGILQLCIDKYVERNSKSCSVTGSEHYFEILTRLGRLTYEEELKAAIRRKEVGKQPKNDTNVKFRNTIEGLSDKEQTFLLDSNILVQYYDSSGSHFRVKNSPLREFLMALFFARSLKLTSADEEVQFYFSFEFPECNPCTLFYLGLLNDDPIPTEFLQALKDNAYNLQFAVDAYNEISNEQNKELLSSAIKPYFTSESAVDFGTVPSAFTRVYFVLELDSTYEQVRSKFKDFHAKRRCSQMEIFILLHISQIYHSDIDKEVEEKWGSYQDVHKSVNLLLNLIAEEELRGFEIYFGGIILLFLGRHDRWIPSYCIIPQSFVTVIDFNTPTQVPREIRNCLTDADENLRAIKLPGDQDQFLLLSADQITSLQPHVKPFPCQA